jgi:hypothetical protein
MSPLAWLAIGFVLGVTATVIVSAVYIAGEVDQAAEDIRQHQWNDRWN